jgi:hypothetical protein
MLQDVEAGFIASAEGFCVSLIWFRSLLRYPSSFLHAFCTNNVEARLHSDGVWDTWQDGHS